MPDSLTTFADPYYLATCPQDPGMADPTAPPILAFYMAPTGIAAVNRARCAATACRYHGGSLTECEVAARVAFRERLQHPLPDAMWRYLAGDL